MNYKYTPSSRFKPKRPIRSFRDLGIYQTTEKISVEVVKKIVPLIPNESSLKNDLADCCMKIPHYIAEAHSIRFDDKEKSMKLLEEVLFLCNKVVVYLEQVRDVYNEQVDRIICDEIIKNIFMQDKKFLIFIKRGEIWNRKQQTKMKNCKINLNRFHKVMLIKTTIKNAIYNIKSIKLLKTFSKNFLPILKIASNIL